MIHSETCEVLYRFFRTSSEYIQGYRGAEPYPETFEIRSVAPPAEAQSVDSAGFPAQVLIPAECVAAADSAPYVQGAPEASAIVTASAESALPTADNPDAPFRSMQELYAAVARCSACGLGATRIKPVAGEGPEELSRLTNSVDVMVIGEGPGADEDRQGRPFVGRAGQLLDKMLEAIQLSRKTNCYITNVVKCRPPQNRDPAPDERSCCAAFLEAQIRFTHPKMILVMGRIAAQHLLQTSEGIGRLRGRFFDYQGIPLMPTYHPSALLRDESLKRPAWEDLKRFRARLQELRARD